MKHVVQDRALLVFTSDFHLSNSGPELNCLGSHFLLVILRQVARGLPELVHVGLNHLILLASDLHQALHGLLSDLQVGRLEGLFNYLLHQEVAFSRHLEILSRVRDTLQQGTDSKTAGFRIGIVLADVVGEGCHDSVFELLGEVRGRQLLADVSDGDQRRQAHLLLSVARVRAEVDKQLGPLASRDLNRCDGCNEKCNLVANHA